jgi:hypothetical protein
VGLLSTLQADIAKKLAEDSLFSDGIPVAVLQENDGDVDTAIERSLAKLGVAVTVSTPEAEQGEGGHPFVTTEILIEVVENVLINRGPAGSKKTWLDLAEGSWAILADWAPPGGWAPLEFLGLSKDTDTRPILASLRLSTRCVVQSG